MQGCLSLIFLIRTIFRFLKSNLQNIRISKIWHLHHVYFSFPPQATPTFSLFLLTNEKIADSLKKLLQRKRLTNNPGCYRHLQLLSLVESKLGWVKSDKPLQRTHQFEPWDRGYQPPNMSPLPPAIGQRFEVEVLLKKPTTIMIKLINQAWLENFYHKVMIINIVIYY